MNVRYICKGERLTLIYSANQRTLLLFVIRDHIGTTPLANLQATLSADMNKIWDSLSKPPELADRKLSEYFDLSFTALPHKILVPDKFEAAVQDLRKRFTDKSREDYVFKPTYHKRIPADGVSFYMENIWVCLSILCHYIHLLKWHNAGTSPVKQGLGSSDPTRIACAVPL